MSTVGTDESIIVRHAVRPRFLIPAAAAVLAAVLVAGLVVAWRVSGGRGDRPNVVLIVTDDQRWDTLATMPAVQRLLVDGGITFRNAFATTPSCCPSRVSLLTGRYSRHTGVLDGSAGNAPGGAPAFDDRSSLATWLDDAGYRTGLVGKYLNDYAELPTGYVPPGWDEWYAVAQSRPQIRYYDYELNENGTIVHYGRAPADYSTTVLHNKALGFLRGADPSAPFFLYFAPIAPHPPATPAPEDVGAPVAEPDAPPSIGVAPAAAGGGIPATSRTRPHCEGKCSGPWARSIARSRRSRTRCGMRGSRRRRTSCSHPTTGSCGASIRSWARSGPTRSRSACRW